MRTSAAEQVPTSDFSPASSKTEIRKHLMAKLDQMRIAAMTGIGPVVNDLSPDVGRTLGKHDDSSGKEQCRRRQFVTCRWTGSGMG
jgi:hypothetical protein